MSIELVPSWEYDEEKGIQRLAWFQPLCPNCHLVKHMGRACIVGLQDVAMRHMAEVNDWTPEEAESYINSQFAVWARRSGLEWSQDLSLLWKRPYGKETHKRHQ